MASPVSVLQRSLAAVPDRGEFELNSPLSFLREKGRPVSAPPMRIDLFESTPSRGNSRRESTLSTSGFSRRVPVSMLALLASSASNTHKSKFVASRPSSSASATPNRQKPQWRTPSNGHVTVPRSATLDHKGEQKEHTPAPKKARDHHLFSVKPRTLSVSNPVELETNAMLVSSLPTFCDLPRDRIIAIANSMKKEHVTFGTVLFKQGQPASRIVIIHSGQVAVERIMMDGKKQGGILSSCLKKASNGDEKTPSRVKVQTGMPGAVFGDFASLFDTKSIETVTVESISGAEILFISIHDLHQHTDGVNLEHMKEKARTAAQFRQDQAAKLSTIMASAVHRYTSHQAIQIPYPSQEELKKINRKMKFDIWHPIGWRDKQPPTSNSRPPRPRSAPLGHSLESSAGRPTSAQARALSPLSEAAVDHSSKGGQGMMRPGSAQSERPRRQIDAAPAGSERPRPASAMERREKGMDEQSSDSEAQQVKRPSSAFLSSRKKWEAPPPIWEANKYGECQDINYRKLFLSTWALPERHLVYTGAKIAVSAAASDDVPHVELDIDALEDLDGTYLATFQ